MLKYGTPKPRDGGLAVQQPLGCRGSRSGLGLRVNLRIGLGFRVSPSITGSKKA